MKIKEKNEQKGLTVVQQLRQVRDKINDEIKDLSPKELIKYLKKQKTLHPGSYWQ